MEPPRALAHPAGTLGQGHPLVAAQGARAPDDPPARHARRSPARQPPALPRLPAARGAPAALPPARPRPRARPPRRLAGLGDTLAPETVRPPRPHPAPAPRRHPRRHPPRPHQRPPRRPQQQDPPDQPPRLRLPLRRPTDRARLPLLRRHHDRAAAMNFTHNSTERRTSRPLRRSCSPPGTVRPRSAWPAWVVVCEGGGRRGVWSTERGARRGFCGMACGNRREAVCPPCAERYRGDASACERRPQGRQGHPRHGRRAPGVFVTLTGPSFGAVHTRGTRPDGRPRRCRPRHDAPVCVHGVRRSCGRVHDEDDSSLGKPICPTASTRPPAR